MVQVSQNYDFKPSGGNYILLKAFLFLSNDRFSKLIFKAKIEGKHYELFKKNI